MNLGFPKSEKLKSRTLIQLLFSEGKSVSQFPVTLVYAPAGLENNIPAQAGVSVSKRNFKRANKRNRIKRLLREAYRLQKSQMLQNLPQQYVFMFLYTGKEMPDFELIQEKMKGLLEKFIQKESVKR